MPAQPVAGRLLRGLGAGRWAPSGLGRSFRKRSRERERAREHERCELATGVQPDNVELSGPHSLRMLAHQVE
jgi:hypothetical protein